MGIISRLITAALVASSLQWHCDASTDSAPSEHLFTVLESYGNCSGDNWTGERPYWMQAPQYCSTRYPAGSVVIPMFVRLNRVKGLRDESFKGMYATRNWINLYASSDLSDRPRILNLYEKIPLTAGRGIANLVFQVREVTHVVMSDNYENNDCTGQMMDVNAYYFGLDRYSFSVVNCDMAMGVRFDLAPNGSVIRTFAESPCIRSSPDWNATVLGTIGQCNGRGSFLRNLTIADETGTPIPRFDIPNIGISFGFAFAGIALAAASIYWLDWDHPIITIVFVFVGATVGSIFLWIPYRSCSEYLPERCAPPSHYYTFFGAFFIAAFCTFFAAFVYDLFWRRIYVYDVVERRRVSVWRFHGYACCRRKGQAKRAIVSWRWDIATPEEFEKSPTLVRVFHRAEALGFRHLLIDVVTLNQNSMDAPAVLRFVRLYRTLPVVVGVENGVEMAEYSSRFWTNFEMLLYKNNKQVFTLSDDLNYPRSMFYAPEAILKSRNVEATLSLDRIRVFLMGYPFTNLLFWYPLRIIARAHVQKRDLDVDLAVKVIADFEHAFNILLRPLLFRRVKFFPFLWMAVIFIDPFMCTGQRCDCRPPPYVGVLIGFLVEIIVVVIGMLMCFRVISWGDDALGLWIGIGLFFGSVILGRVASLLFSISHLSLILHRALLRNESARTFAIAVGEGVESPVKALTV